MDKLNDPSRLLDFDNNNMDISIVSTKLSNVAPSIALSIKNGYKTYGRGNKKVEILKDFSMEVERGTIYSLLGSSGCGKTTVLSCCVGLRNLDGGEIKIFGHKPGTWASGVPGKRLGYMPQEIALEDFSTISETLWYYGRLYGMTKNQVEPNIKFLVDFLRLPKASRRIHTLSGGQKRRVSMAVALIHNPELLILDEPTVGVDPLLRQSIWNYLTRLVSTGKTTVIITTHYIEEAHSSNRVGLMRNGVLLAENSPETLLMQYNEKLLEKVVIKLCLQQTTESGNLMSEVKTETPSTSASSSSTSSASPRPSPSSSVCDIKGAMDAETEQEKAVVGISFRRRNTEEMFSPNVLMHRASLNTSYYTPPTISERFMLSLTKITGYMLKNFQKITRSLLVLLCLLLLPAVIISVTCSVIGRDLHDLPFGVINSELVNSTKNSCDSGVGCPFEDNYEGYMSCRFLELLSPYTFNLKTYDSEEEAMQDLYLTKIKGYMKFNQNFTRTIAERVALGLHVEKDVIVGSTVHIQLDMSNTLIGVTLKKVLLENLQAFLTNLSMSCDINPEVNGIPVVFDTPVYGTEDTAYTEYIAASFIVAIIFMLQMGTGSTSFIMDYKIGVVQRAQVAGMSIAEIIIAYQITNTILLVLEIGVTFICVTALFDVTVQGSMFLVFLLTVMVGVMGLSLGFLLTTFVKDELQSVMTNLSIFLPNLIMSGLIWPLVALPISLQYISMFLPITYPGESVRSIFSRGCDFFHPAVWPGFLTTVVWFTVYCAITVIAHKVFQGKK